MLENTILVLAILAIVLAIVGAALSYLHFYRREHLHCPKCGYDWKPPLLRMIFSVNAVDGKIIRCPRCGEKEFMRAERDVLFSEKE
ncbi:MAG: hypothetical protein ACOX6P_08705 [Candidatus Merdivicinus sp.]|jgi:predicted RNA-binding Zn-ribbon protein involved in translation (DUF1610 family)